MNISNLFRIHEQQQQQQQHCLGEASQKSL